MRILLRYVGDCNYVRLFSSVYRIEYHREYYYLHQSHVTLMTILRNGCQRMSAENNYGYLKGRLPTVLDKQDENERVEFANLVLELTNTTRQYIGDILIENLNCSTINIKEMKRKVDVSI